MKPLNPSRPSPETLEVTEIFQSLQGEGPFMGRPAVFVRLSGCVRPFCPWCDTVYAQGTGKKVGIMELIERIKAYAIDFIVITGGEPFVQWDGGLCVLDRRLTDLGFKIQYETSGKIKLPQETRGVKVCSPKFMDGVWHFLPENAARVDAFKFVVNNDFKRIIAFKDHYGIPKEKIWLMPLGATRKEQLDRMPAVFRFCKTHQLNYSPRLHILAFNQKQGV